MAGTTHLATSEPEIDLRCVLKVYSWTSKFLSPSAAPQILVPDILMGLTLVTDEVRNLRECYGVKVWQPLKNPLEFVRTCLENCQKEHGGQCCGSPQVLPTRLIDVSGRRDYAKLIETTSASYEAPLTGQYCALSHAWGTSRTRYLTCHNNDGEPCPTP